MAAIISEKAIRHLETKVHELEKADHEMDKTVAQVIANQEHHRNKLDELFDKTTQMFEKHTARIDALEKKDERREGRKEVISQILNNKVLIGIFIVIVLLVGALNKDVITHIWFNS